MVAPRAIVIDPLFDDDAIGRKGPPTDQAPGLGDPSRIVQLDNEPFGPGAVTNLKESLRQRLALREPLAVLGRHQKRFDHLGVNKVAVELI